MVSAPLLGIAPWAIDRSGASTALDSLLEQCEQAERLGYHSVWIPESHFTERGATPAPLLLLAAIAARTRRLHLATTSYLLPIRHPLHVAAEVAVLDRLSGGRVILGVGRGFRSATFEAFNVPRSEKRDRFEAALETMKRAWRGEVVVDGEERVRLAPRPLQDPHPPIWVAAFGPKALAQAGRLALPYLASPMEPLPLLRENYARHREQLPEDAETDDMPVPVMRTVFVTRSREAASRVRDALEQQAAAMRRGAGARLARRGDGALEDIALIGEPSAIADGMARYQEELGMTHLIARGHMPGATPDETRQSIELLAALGQSYGI